MLQPTVHVKPLSCCNAWPPASYLQTCGLLTVPIVILWITGYGILQECAYWKYIKDMDKLELRLIKAWSGVHQSIIDQAIDQSEFVLLYVSTQN